MRMLYDVDNKVQIAVQFNTNVILDFVIISLQFSPVSEKLSASYFLIFLLLSVLISLPKSSFCLIILRNYVGQLLLFRSCFTDLTHLVPLYLNVSLHSL